MFKLTIIDKAGNILSDVEEMPKKIILGDIEDQRPEAIILNRIINKILKDESLLELKEKNTEVRIRIEYTRQAINQEEIDEIIKKLETNNQPQIMLDQNILNTPLQEGQSYTSQSGLSFEVIKLGDGERPQITSTVLVHYHGTLEDGTVFDSSVDRDEKIEFPLAGVIAG